MLINAEHDSVDYACTDDLNPCLYNMMNLLTALMAEFPASEMPCDRDPSILYPSNKDGYSVILGLRSSGYINAIADHLTQGYGVIAISTQTDNMMASYSDLQPVLAHNSKFVLIGSASKCSI